jgi:pheromone shutdown protein TraB
MKSNNKQSSELLNSSDKQNHTTSKTKNAIISNDSLSLTNITFLGTSHIANESVNEIKKSVEEINPEIITVELDKDRLHGLINKKNDRISLKNIKLIKEIGLAGFIFAYIASNVQKKLGSLVNMAPGSDMLSAVKIASQKGIKVALIDQHVNVTLKNISKKVSVFEKLKIVFDIISNLLFPFKAKKEFEAVGLKNIDLSKVPSDYLISKMLLRTKTKYPAFYKVLVEDRNEFMTKKIFHIMLKNPNSKIVCVIGAGHKSEMELLIKEKIEKYNAGLIDII